MTDTRKMFSEIAAVLDGQQIDGGCETCDAYQVLTQASPGVLVITISHDDECPTLARINNRDE